MQLPLKKIQWVEFHEHPISHPKNVKVELFEIYSKRLKQSEEQQEKYNHPLYCKLILEKVLQLNPVLLSRFLDYQCELLNRPYIWLTSLDLVLEYNADLIIEFNQALKLNDALNIIHEKRILYQKVPIIYREDDYEDKNPFQFDMIKKELDQLKTYHQKKTFLLRMKTNYLQQQYNYDNIDGVDFDVQIDLELAYLQSIQKMKKKKDFNMEAQPLILIWEGQINILVDFYYQCLNYQTEENRPILKATKKMIEDFIVKHHRKPDGSKFNATTIRTILTPSRNEKRPNEDKRIDLNKIIERYKE